MNDVSLYSLSLYLSYSNVNLDFFHEQKRSENISNAEKQLFKANFQNDKALV